MSNHHGYTSGEFKEQYSPDYQHLGSQTSRYFDIRKERQKDKTNKKLRSSDGQRSGNDQFVSNEQYTSSSGNHCVAKKTTDILQSASLAFEENSEITRVKVSQSFHLCAKRNLNIDIWKQTHDQEKAREVHHRRFQATLDLLVKTFESDAFAAKFQNLKTLRVRFRVQYTTQSSRQILAVTGDHHILGAWKSFVPLKRAEDGFWFCSIMFPMDIRVEWKFVLVVNGEIVHWEECGNRQLEVPKESEDEEIQLYCTWGRH